MGRFSSNLEDGSVKTHLHTSPIVVKNTFYMTEAKPTAEGLGSIIGWDGVMNRAECTSDPR